MNLYSIIKKLTFSAGVLAVLYFAATFQTPSERAEAAKAVRLTSLSEVTYPAQDWGKVIFPQMEKMSPKANSPYSPNRWSHYQYTPAKGVAARKRNLWFVISGGAPPRGSYAEAYDAEKLNYIEAINRYLNRIGMRDQVSVNLLIVMHTRDSQSFVDDYFLTHRSGLCGKAFERCVDNVYLTGLISPRGDDRAYGVWMPQFVGSVGTSYKDHIVKVTGADGAEINYISNGSKGVNYRINWFFMTDEEQNLISNLSPWSGWRYPGRENLGSQYTLLHAVLSEINRVLSVGQDVISNALSYVDVNFFEPIRIETAYADEVAQAQTRHMNRQLVLNDQRLGPPNWTTLCLVAEFSGLKTPPKGCITADSMFRPYKGE